MSTDAEQAAEVLGEVVWLGDQPTPQELELGEAVARHISNRNRTEEEP